jgi:hypothetical protein
MDGRKPKTMLGLWLLAVLLPAQAQEVFYIHTDAQGSTVAETDANRNVVARFEYEPFGQRIGPGSDDKPGYTGHVMDAVTGLVQMQQRYYDPGSVCFCRSIRLRFVRSRSRTSVGTATLGIIRTGLLILMGGKLSQISLLSSTRHRPESY